MLCALLKLLNRYRKQRLPSQKAAILYRVGFKKVAFGGEMIITSVSPFF